MFKSQYKGVLDDWKIQLICSRARYYKFRECDLDDALQQVALALLDLVYDQEHASQAAETTVIVAVIDRQLLKMRRSQTRYERRVVTEDEGLDERFDLVRDDACWLRSNIDLTDVDDAFKSLPLELRRVAELLMLGHSFHQAAVQLGVSWHTVNRVARDLRKLFQQLGLGTPRRIGHKASPSQTCDKELRDVG